MTLTRQRHDGTSHSPSHFADFNPDFAIDFGAPHNFQNLETAASRATSSRAAISHSLLSPTSPQRSLLQTSLLKSALFSSAARVVLGLSLCAVATLPSVARQSRTRSWKTNASQTRWSQMRSSQTRSSRARKAVGVPGWTSGSQTYLRARPGEQTPAVAKVPRHTRVFVWGTFEGWYRVETPDHIFGWVHHSVLNAPDADKLVELSHRKAILASDRTATQKVYGAPKLVPVRDNSANNAAKSSTRNVAANTSENAAQAGNGASTAAKNVEVSTSQEPVQALSPAQTLAAKAAEVRALEAKTAAAKAELIRAEKEAARAEQAKSEQEKFRQLSAAQALAHEKAVKLEEQRVAKAQADARLEEAAHQARWAQQQLDAQLRLVQQDKVRQNAATGKVATAVVVAPAKPKLTKHQINVEARRQARIAAYQKRVAAYRNRLAWRQARGKERQNRLALERTQLRRELGTQVNAQSSTQIGAEGAQNVAVSPLRPLSPAELMKAREQYLDGQRKAQPEVATNAAISSNGTAPNASQNASSDFSQSSRANSSGEKANADVNANDGENAVSVAPSVWKGASSAASSTAPSMLALSSANLTAKKADSPATQVSTTKAAAMKSAPVRLAQSPEFSRGRALASRGGSPLMRYANRGGSPRDYARAASNSSLGQGIVKQALSYRGMPYIMGAASPSRGFDCSGLIYFMLRQRGYNPPRTAEGLSHYGVAVARDQLQPGDILLFANTYKRGISHAGIYMGNGLFVHAANPSRGVSTNALSERYYASKYWGARRIK